MAASRLAHLTISRPAQVTFFVFVFTLRQERLRINRFASVFDGGI